MGVPEKKEKSSYFFPDYQLTIEADSREEAESKLQEILVKTK